DGRPYRAETELLQKNIISQATYDKIADSITAKRSRRPRRGPRPEVMDAKKKRPQRSSAFNSLPCFLRTIQLLTTSFDFLSSLSHMKRECRRCLSGVHSVNSNCGDPDATTFAPHLSLSVCVFDFCYFHYSFRFPLAYAASSRANKMGMRHFWQRTPRYH